MVQSGLAAVLLFKTSLVLMMFFCLDGVPWSSLVKIFLETLGVDTLFYYIAVAHRRRMYLCYICMCRSHVAA